MAELKIYRGRSRTYARFINRFSKLSYYLFAGGEDFSDIIFKMVDLKASKKILDIGCGVGNLLVDIRERLNKKNNNSLVVAADYSQEMINIALNKFENNEDKLLFVICDASRLPFKSGTFDICFNVLLLHHLPSTLKIQVLFEVARTLTPNGACVLMDIDKPTTVLGWLIASLRWHVSTIRDNFQYGLKSFYTQARLMPEMKIKKMGLFSYYLLRKTNCITK